MLYYFDIISQLITVTINLLNRKYGKKYQLKRKKTTIHSNFHDVMTQSHFTSTLEPPNHPIGKICQGDYDVTPCVLNTIREVGLFMYR